MNEQGFTSRYAIRKALGKYPPWQGYEVTDSLSGKDYLLFTLLHGADASISTDDLLMRGELFADIASGQSRALSIQDNGGGAFFLLPSLRIAPLTKVLPSLAPEESLALARSLTGTLLDCASTGRFLGNLSIESIVVIEGTVSILPTAYLIPPEVLGFLDPADSRCGGIQPLYRDLDDLGVILALFQRYLPAGADRECALLSEALRRIGPGAESGSIRELAASLCSFAGREGPPPPLTAGRRPPLRWPAGIESAVRDVARAAKENDRQIIMLRGPSGSGKTAFLEQAASSAAISEGLRPFGPVGDRDTFGEIDEAADQQRSEAVLHDDHHLDPILCGHVVDRISRDLEGRRLAVVCVGDDPPPGFAEAVSREAAARGFTVVDLALPGLDPQDRREAALALLHEDDRPEARRSLSDGDPLSVMLLKVRLASEPGMRRPAAGAGPLSVLSSEEKSVLSFLAVFRFEAPISLLKGVFSIEEGRFYEVLHRLVSLGFVRGRAERSPICAGRLCTVYRIAGGGLARIIERSIPAARRRELHARIAQILKEAPGAPPVYVFYHLTRCGEDKEAAFRGLQVFQQLLGRKRLGAVACFHEGFLRAKLDRRLPGEVRLELMLELGDFYLTIGETDRAESFYRLCRERTSRDQITQGHRSLAVEAIRRECEILEKRGEFTRAQGLLRKALDSHGEHLLIQERAALYNDLAWVDYRLGLFDQSWENCLLVHRLLDKKLHPAELAQSYNLMGAINWNRSKYDEALMCHKRCLALREDGNDDLGVAASLNNLGLVYRSMGRVREALESFTKSMTIKQRNNNQPGLAAVHLNLALTYLDLEDTEKAEANCRTAIGIAEDIGNLQLIAEASGTLGEICFMRCDHGKAREHYFRDLHICNKTKSLREKAVVFRRLGELSLAEGKPDETKRLLDNARELNDRIRSRLETALLDLLEGRILLAEGKRELGKRKLEETAFELSLLGRKGTASSVAAEIGELYLEEGNEPLAREYLLRAASLLAETDSPPRQVVRLQEQLERHSALEPQTIHTDSARFRALCRMISLIRTIRDPDRLYATITETARSITGMERAALIVQNDGQDTYRILASTGDFDSETILTDKNIISILSITRQLGYPLDISRTRIPEGKVAGDFLEDHPGIICTPLWIQDAVTGFLYLDSPRGTAGAGDEDHTFLVAFSQQVALGLERMYLADRVRRTERPAPAPNIRARERVAFQDIIGKSPAIRHIYELIDGIKEMDTTVLLTGPNGAGKDLIARTIHHTGTRRDKPLHTLNCAAIPRELIESELFGHEKGSFTGAYRQKIGHFESASEGTIFLNEIGDLPLEIQPKLLQVLEHRNFFRVGGTVEIRTDARIICATNKDLLQLVRDGRFREDLYYRINIFPIRVPGLSERREDIKLLCDHFLTIFCRLYNTPMKRISPEAAAYLAEYDWPGNVREL
ncbi:MAG: sigma 54-interacting transcriptional regulator, partial [Candidatus Krumholzibacteria bacterium]|nr:sigma 54-interacting transcriptional regulator [Candidatus Krumholzibacteria bacterium]